MKIAIIGAGFTGLSAAYELTKEGHEVFVFEKDAGPGGLAIGYKEKNWNWSLEKYYHHWFTNDKYILNLAKEINFDIIIKKPKTSVFIKNKTYLLDSPIAVLRFPLLSLMERLRMGLVLGLLRYNPFWKPLEKYNAATFLSKTIGKKAFEMIWKPQLTNKFGKFYENVSLAWFWARINKRTSSLVYPKGGFLNFANELTKQIKNKGGHFLFNTNIIELKPGENIFLNYEDVNGKIVNSSFEKVIVTTPSAIFLKITPQLPKAYKKELAKLINIGATNLVIRLKKPFFNDGTYWVSICEDNSPIMSIVEHTNYMDKKNYNNEHIIYIGNYKPATDRFFSIAKEDLLKEFNNYLLKINSDYYNNIIGYELFRDPFAQPIISINYSKILPSFITPLKNVYLANIEQVYPWDRGTNYAVELGQKIAKIATS